MRGGVGNEIDRYEETEVRLRDFSAAIDAMLADASLWAIPRHPNDIVDETQLRPFMENLLRRITEEVDRGEVAHAWILRDITAMRKLLMDFTRPDAPITLSEAENGVRLCRESLEYMRLSMTVLEPSPVADLAMTIADAITWALRSVRDWLRPDNKKAL